MVSNEGHRFYKTPETKGRVTEKKGEKLSTGASVRVEIKDGNESICAQSRANDGSN